MPSLQESAQIGDKVSFKVNVSNDSNTDGEEVVQLYVRKKDDPSAINKSLRAFKRVKVPANSAVDVEFILDENAFKTYDPSVEEMTVTPGEYLIYYGGSSETPSFKTLTLL